MDVFKIPFAQIDQISDRDKAYDREDARLRPFYKYTPTLASFEQILEDKSKEATPREALVQALCQQHPAEKTHELVQRNIEALEKPTTFTVTTAHQPSLFTGPLYYIYKIISTINLSKLLNANFSEYRFVPVFICGAEDHDFEEINHLNIFNKRIVWENEEAGATGFMKTATLQPILQDLKEILGDSPNAAQIFAQLEQAYSNQALYGRAAIEFTQRLFEGDGLVVADMSDPLLKKQFVPIIKKEIFEQPSKAFVEEATLRLEAAGFSGQAHAREINFFYLGDQFRERIVEEDGIYKVLNTDYAFTKEELINEIEEHPERFSPNVIMRPIYQEFTLPNLAYIGGGGELAYWLERQHQFEHFGINYPMLIRRNSVLFIDKGANKRIQKIGLDLSDLFKDTDFLIKSFVKEQADGELSLAEEKEMLQELFKRVEAKAAEVDQTLVKTAGAESAKQLKSLEQFEGRLMRAEKKKHETAVNQIRSLKDKLFPNNGLQERHDNFLPFYLKYGDEFFEVLKQHLHPLEKGFVVIQDS